ncbi:hypothetical protein CPC08DRAFT_649946, partial [Agrocybe pediades]
QAQIQVLNSDYNATDIQFPLVKTTRIKSKDYFENVFPGSPREQAMKLLYNVRDASTLNIFTLTCARAISSAYYRSPKRDGVMIQHSAVANGPWARYNMDRTLT